MTYVCSEKSASLWPYGHCHIEQEAGLWSDNNTVSRCRRAHYLRNAHPPFWLNVDVNALCPSYRPLPNFWLQTGSDMVKDFLIYRIKMEYLPIHWDLTKFLLLKLTNSFILCATMCTMCMTAPLSVLTLTANVGNLKSTDRNTDGHLQGYI